MLNRLHAASEKGASMVEYSLLVVLIALIALFAVQSAGESLSETYTHIAVEVEAAGN
jgi:Flp pilus assembly pilin Flp